MKRATVVKVYGMIEMAHAPDVLQAVLIRVDAPVKYGDGQQTDHIYIVAAQPRHRPGIVVRAYYADRLGCRLWHTPLIEKTGTLSLRETMTEAGYDVSSWPKDIV